MPFLGRKGQAHFEAYIEGPVVQGQLRKKDFRNVMHSSSSSNAVQWQSIVLVRQYCIMYEYRRIHVEISLLDE